MSFHLKPYSSISKRELVILAARMTDYYNNPPASYYAIADEASEKYTKDQLPFHCHLASQAFPGAEVLELGCGTAHFCPRIEEHGGIYHGIDYSQDLIERNQNLFPNARFYRMGSQNQKTYDIVASLYTIEHVVHPPSYLQQLWNYCKPGGLIGVICPDFVDGRGIPLSIYYGTSPDRIRNKLVRGRFWDAILHLWELKIAAPLWKRRARTMSSGAFWMNLNPSDLAANRHEIDGDAIHFPRMLDIANWFEKRGAMIEATSSTLPDISEEILMHNCYVLARKPK